MMTYAWHLPAPAILAALALDVVAGDPQWLPHPVRLVGGAITRGEALLWAGKPLRDLYSGALLSAAVVCATAVVGWALIAAASMGGSLAGLMVAVVLAWTTIALRGLDRAALAVESSLSLEKLASARNEIRALVGRDPDALDRAGLIRAAIESVAENSSDAVIAPMLYLFVGGPVAAMAFKAVNTLDSMIGYLSPRYRSFGCAAARLDDVANLVPARVTALCLIAAAAIVSRRGRQAYDTCVADASKSRSPNAGYPESAVAGALGVQLGGDAIYEGEVEHRPVIGLAERELELPDIRSARILMRTATAIAFVLFALSRYLIVGVLS